MKKQEINFRDELRMRWCDGQIDEEYTQLIRTLRLTEAYLRKRGFNEECIERISYMPLSILETFALRELAA